MGWFWAENKSPSSTGIGTKHISVGACPVKHGKVKASVESACPVKHAKVDVSAELTCPVMHTSPAQFDESACPVMHKREISGKLNPLNNIPKSLSTGKHSSQKMDLPTVRTISSIPKGSNSKEFWEYPSPQQMYNAMIRKGKIDTNTGEEIPEDAVESMVFVHNFLNEGCWQEVLEWEKPYTEKTNVAPKLLKFMGKPDQLSPVKHAKVDVSAELTCPVMHTSPAQFDESACPVMHKREISGKLNPLNNIPKSLSTGKHSSQKMDLPTVRTISSIPKGSNSKEFWEYPSPQQMYNAMIRKGKIDTNTGEEIPEDAVESMVFVHNFLNEGCWQEVLEWEKPYTEKTNVAPKLLKFMGKPDQLSPRAKWYQMLGKWFPNHFYGEAPFDRHDWVILRADPTSTDPETPGLKKVRYVIDFYGGPDDSDGLPTFNLDVRPALDDASNARDRFVRYTQPIMDNYFGSSKK